MNWTITEESARKFKFGPKEWKADKIKFDEKFPGFGLRIRTDEKTGREHRTYIFQYKLGHKHRRMNCGMVGKVTAAQARRAAEGHAASLVQHKDPANERAVVRKEASHTVGATIEKYLEAKKPKMRPRSFYQTSRHLELNWKPLHGLSINNVSRANVAAEANIIARRGPVAANRSRASLSAFFRWAIGEGLCDHNPVAGTNQQQENPPRARTLSDAEAATVFLACPENAYGRIVQLLLLTGCRRDEIGGLRWSEIDFDAKTITLPGSRTKNNTEHVVPLSDRALAILEAIPRRADYGHVFGVVEGGYKGFSVSKAKLETRVKLKEPWTLHDLRRTVRTGLGNLGVAPHVAEAVLNHLPARLVRTYDRNTYEPEKRAALDAWANHLAVAVAKASGANVTTLRKA